MDSLQIEITPEQGGVQLFKLSGPFTISTMFDFQQLVREHTAPVTLIDVAEVPYMDSAALGALLGFHVSCGREGRKYGLVAVSDRLKTLFQVAGVQGILVGYPTVEAAKAAVAA
jgi:anti-sigma B factor antagonist